MLPEKFYRQIYADNQHVYSNKVCFLPYPWTLAEKSQFLKSERYGGVLINKKDKATSFL